MDALNSESGVATTLGWSLVNEVDGTSELYIGESVPTGYTGTTYAVGPEHCKSWSLPLMDMGVGGVNVYNMVGYTSCALLLAEYPYIGVQPETFELMLEVLYEFNSNWQDETNPTTGSRTAYVDGSCDDLISLPLPDIQFEINANNFSVQPQNYLNDYTYTTAAGDTKEVC